MVNLGETTSKAALARQARVKYYEVAGELKRNKPLRYEDALKSLEREREREREHYLTIPKDETFMLICPGIDWGSSRLPTRYYPDEPDDERPIYIADVVSSYDIGKPSIDDEYLVRGVFDNYALERERRKDQTLRYDTERATLVRERACINAEAYEKARDLFLTKLIGETAPSSTSVDNGTFSDTYELQDGSSLMKQYKDEDRETLLAAYLLIPPEAL